MVLRMGLEPTHLATYAPQAYVYTNSTTPAHIRGNSINEVL